MKSESAFFAGSGAKIGGPISAARRPRPVAQICWQQHLLGI